MNGEHPWWKSVLLATIILVVVDLIYLNYRIVTIKNNSVVTVRKPSNQESYPNLQEITPNTEAATENLADEFVILENKIKEATASISEKVAALSKSTTSPQISYSPASSTLLLKENYIPLGTGSTNSTEWVDLPGVEAYIAPLNYGTIKEIYFEAGLNVPTGNGRVYARLKNVTGNTGLIESEVSREGSSPGLVSSGKIPVPATTILYRVQLKSTLGADASLTSARIKIFAY